jgi:hypothetical protein
VCGAQCVCMCVCGVYFARAGVGVCNGLYMYIPTSKLNAGTTRCIFENEISWTRPV